MVLNPKPNERYTYKDYLEWSDEERWELIDGVPYNMTPAPFDVRLFPNEKKNDNNVVQPDRTVICDEKKMTINGCEGVPDLVIEVLSPSTAKKDRREKKRIYERVRVKEYWIVAPFLHD